MPSHTQYDIKGLVGAVKTREALEEAELRKFGGPGTPPQSPASSSLHAPVYNQKGELFAGQFIKKHFAFTLPKNIKQDTIIEYQGKDNKYHYGVVVKTDDSRQSKIEVKDLSVDEVTKFKDKHPSSEIYTLTDDDAKAIDASVNKLRDIINNLDGSDFIIFHIVSFFLFKGVFEQESVTDIFISVYLRVLALAILLISTFYLSLYFIN